MDWIINAYANVSGLWKKVAHYLPLVGGAGSVLIGAGNILLELANSSDASAALHVLQGIAGDPNTKLITAGLVALGIHQNHIDNKAAIAAPQTPELPK